GAMGGMAVPGPALAQADHLHRELEKASEVAVLQAQVESLTQELACLRSRSTLEIEMLTKELAEVRSQSAAQIGALVRELVGLRSQLCFIGQAALEEMGGARLASPPAVSWRHRQHRVHRGELAGALRRARTRARAAPRRGGCSAQLRRRPRGRRGAGLRPEADRDGGAEVPAQRRLHASSDGLPRAAIGAHAAEPGRVLHVGDAGAR
ncbi:unnamed protein product, partial [Prorocentrum cordatum]